MHNTYTESNIWEKQSRSLACNTASRHVSWFRWVVCKGNYLLKHTCASLTQLLGAIPVEKSHQRFKTRIHKITRVFWETSDATRGLCESYMEPEITRCQCRMGGRWKSFKHITPLAVQLLRQKDGCPHGYQFLDHWLLGVRRGEEEHMVRGVLQGKHFLGRNIPRAKWASRPLSQQAFWKQTCLGIPQVQAAGLRPGPWTTLLWPLTQAIGIRGTVSWTLPTRQTVRMTCRGKRTAGRGVRVCVGGQGLYFPDQGVTHLARGRGQRQNPGMAPPALCLVPRDEPCPPLGHAHP